MPLYTGSRPFTGSTSGRPIPAAAVATPGTTIHTVGPTATANYEEHFVYASNTATADRFVTIEYGGTSTGDHIWASITAQGGPELVIPGWRLTATTSIIRAFATATGGINVSGFFNRVT